MILTNLISDKLKLAIAKKGNATFVVSGGTAGGSAASASVGTVDRYRLERVRLHCRYGHPGHDIHDVGRY